MKLVAPTECLGRSFGDEEALRLIAKHGFDGFDYSMFDMGLMGCALSDDGWLAHVKALKALSRELFLPCLQAHAPFPVITKGLPMILRAIQIAGELECPVMVVHPCNDWNAEKNAEEIYAKILPAAKASGVKIATENMWNWSKETGVLPAACSTPEDFLAHVKAVNDPFMGACVDIGHAHMQGTGCEGAAAMLRTLGKHVIALHVHDNDLIHDSHSIPYNANIPWEDVIAALRDIQYEGNLTLEADYFMERFPAECREATLPLYHSVGRYLIKRITE
ncbi:MAG: sugar phosphate isomerase/epimerase [Clostridia bacterium]|nr:sugar phosphate isomerase/epimerase [Clostridia bacterium]